MLGFVYCKRLQSLLAISSKYVYLGDSTTHLTSPNAVFRSFSSVALPDSIFKKDEDKRQKKIYFTVPYLINSCGLSHESAASVSKRVNFMSREKPDAVLRLLRDHGFTNTHISKLVKKIPFVLLAKPEKNLLPKLYFLHSIGFSRSDLPKVICRNPLFLFRSLEKSIIPCYDFLKKFLDNDDRRVLSVLRATWRMLLHNQQKIIIANASILRKHGVPQSIISQSLTCYPNLMIIYNVKIAGFVKKAIEMGFKPSSSTLVQGLHALSHFSQATWENKMRLYRSLGWSEDEFWLAFKKHPTCIKSSEKKISSVVDFLVNKMGWQTSDVARHPNVLCYSMEKRIY